MFCGGSNRFGDAGAVDRSQARSGPLRIFFRFLRGILRREEAAYREACNECLHNYSVN